MEKRLPLALILSLAFVFLYFGFINPPTRNAPATPVAPAAGDASRPDTPAGAGPAASGVTGDAPETSRAVPFAGEGYVAEFETRGASLAWLELTDYHTKPGVPDRLRLLSRIDGHTPSLLLHDFSDEWGLDRTNWEVEAGKNDLGRDQLVFTRRLDNGLVVVRTVSDRGLRYAFDMSLEVRNEGATDMAGTLTLVQQASHGLLDENDGATFMMTAPTALAVVRGPDGSALTKWSGKDLDTGAPRRIGPDETLLAAGAMTNYFTALLVPASGTGVSQVEPAAVQDALRLDAAVEAGHPATEAARTALRAELAPKFLHNAAASLQLTSTPPAPGKTLRWEFSVYAGPLDSKLADAPDHAYLHPVVEERYGRMAWINHALLATLRFFHSLAGNWGVAIILLTLLVRILLFPLNRVQQSSMQRYSAAMQRLKPQIDALKAKYKSNMRKFNEEQMQLLKQEGVRPPLGGCLLIFLQFPIWVSLFQILRSHTELRHAPFIWWVHDLSSPDRMPFPWFVHSINVLPILMAAAQIVQMRLQPKPLDASQAQMQKMMGMLMPVMMLYFLYSYPSGLSLYIFTSSLFGIAEYQIVKKLWPVPVVAPVAVPAKAKGKG